MSTTAKTLEALANREYKWGFVSDIEADALPPGLNDDVIRAISARKKEPEFMLEWRLRAYRHWLKMERRPGSRSGRTSPIRPSTTSRSSTTRPRSGRSTGRPVSTRWTRSSSRLSRSSASHSPSASGWPGWPSTPCSTASPWPRRSRRSWPSSASSSARSPRPCSTTPDLVQKYLGSVVPYTDNFYATLSSAVFFDGRIVRSGSKELALELERKGYDWIREEVAAG